MLVETHCELQSCSPLGQLVEQTPPLQTWPELHAWPHVPQFAVLVEVLTQALLHSVSPEGQLVPQLLPTQV